MRPMRSHGWTLLSAAVALLAAPPVRAQQPSDSAAVTATAARFHAALATGDSAGAAALLADDALVLETGDIETRAQYLAHHIRADIQFARSTRTERERTLVRQQGDVAWVTSSTRVRGRFRGRVVNSRGAELMVLTRDGTGWRIAAVHWSSRKVTR